LKTKSNKFAKFIYGKILLFKKRNTE